MEKLVHQTSLCPIKPKLGKIDAHIFLEELQARLENHPGVYKSLISILDSFYKDRDIQGFLTRISRLIFPFPDILEKVNSWLPHDLFLSYGSGENSIIVKHGTYTRSILLQPR